MQVHYSALQRLLKVLGINNSALFQIIMEFGFTVPGGLIAFFTLDTVGRRIMQAIGFVGMAISFLLFVAVKPIAPAIVALILYGLNRLFAQAGPGSVSASGMLGVELAPTKVRGIVQSITVASGRIGALAVSFLFPFLLQTYGLGVTIAFLGIVAFISAALTYFGIPETKGKSLEVASGEDSVSMRESIKE